MFYVSYSVWSLIRCFNQDINLESGTRGELLWWDAEIDVGPLASQR